MEKLSDKELEKFMSYHVSMMTGLWKEAQKRAAKQLRLETGCFALGLVASVANFATNAIPTSVLPTLAWIVAFGFLLVKLFYATALRIFNLMALEVAQQMVEFAIKEKEQNG